MRRPSPLPPIAGDSHRGGDGKPRPEHPRDSSLTAPSADATPDESPTAPITPITAPIGMAALRPEPFENTPDPTAAGPNQPVRLRQVWAAARDRRRALRAEVRRFTVRQRRRRAVWIAAAASLVLLVIASLAAAYSPLFAVERITVVGTAKLDPQAVESALSDQIGRAFPLVDESAVKAALIGFPLVESYALEARPPHDLIVRIVERTPIGYLQTRAGFALVDAAGVTLATSETAGSDAPLLTITGGTDSAAFDAAGLVMRSLPAAIRIQVTGVSASTPDDVTLALGASNAIVVWGNAEDSAMKAIVLESAMKARPPAGVSEYDVSSPSAVVVR